MELKKTTALILSVFILLANSVTGILPVMAEDNDIPDEQAEQIEEPVSGMQEETEDTEDDSVIQESGPSEPEEFSGWTLRYESGEGVRYEDGLTLEETIPSDDPDPVFTLYDYPSKEGYVPDGWRIVSEADPDSELLCSAGDPLNPRDISETGGVLIAEPVWLKLFSVTVIYELNCPDARLEDSESSDSRILFENCTRKLFDIRLNALAEGKIFRGWTEDPASPVLLDQEDAMQELADRIIAQDLTEITLYGVWEEAEETAEPEPEQEPQNDTPYHVIYRTFGSDCVFAEEEPLEWEQGLYTQDEYTLHDDVTIDQEVSREGYLFAGWADSLEEAETGTITWQNGDTAGRLFETLGEDLILYAVWEAPELYTLRCYVNGGVIEGAPANKKGIAVAEIPASGLDSLVITRNGYDFAGWFSDSKFKKPVTADTFQLNPKSMTLHAKWAPKTYRICFDLNDDNKTGALITGAEPVSGESYDAVKDGFVFGKKQKLTPKAKAPGYTFLGWSPDPDAVSAKYKSGKSYKNYSPDGEDTTLYAVWKLKSYKLKIHVSGGSYGDVSPFSLKPAKIKSGVFSTSWTVEDDSTLQYITVPMDQSDYPEDERYRTFFTKPGYTFAGWYTDSKYKKPVSREALKEPGNHTVYAKWTAVNYTVRLNANAENAWFTDADGNRTTAKDIDVTYNRKTKITAAPAREGYTFRGWSTDPDASDVKYTNSKKYKRFGTVIPKAGAIVDLYAVWKNKPGTLESGLNNVTYSGVKLSVYQAEEGYSLQMLSAGEGRLKNIKDYSNSGLDIAAMVNANYFQMRTDAADPFGTHYGVEQTYDGVDLAPKRSGLISYYQTNDGTISWMRSDQYYLQNSDVIFACTPYSVLRHNGQTVNVRSTSLGDKENTASYQTMVMRVHGVWCLVVSRTQTYPRIMRKYAESLNAEEAILMDGGGSSQMLAYTDGAYKEVRYTGRGIPNVLCIAKEH